MPRQTARDAADRFLREVLPLKPTLVIWETGTMEAVRGTGVDDFRETVQGGIDELSISAALEPGSAAEVARALHRVFVGR